MVAQKLIPTLRGGGDAVSYTDDMQKRDALTIVGVALIAIAIGVVVFVSGNGNVKNTASVATNQLPAVVVPFTKITQGKQSAIARRVNYFITSPTQLSELWKLVGATGAPPKVDFKTHAVIAIFAGNESSTSIAVAKIEDADTRMVSIALAKPDTTCAKKSSTVSPYEVVVVPTTSLPLAHQDIVTTAGCPK